MAVVTRLRTQVNALRQQSDQNPGDAPKPPDAWYARFRRASSSPKNATSLPTERLSHRDDIDPIALLTALRDTADAVQNHESDIAGKNFSPPPSVTTDRPPAVNVESASIAYPELDLAVPGPLEAGHAQATTDKVARQDDSPEISRQDNAIGSSSKAKAALNWPNSNEPADIGSVNSNDLVRDLLPPKEKRPSSPGTGESSVTLAENVPAHHDPIRGIEAIPEDVEEEIIHADSMPQKATLIKQTPFLAHRTDDAKPDASDAILGIAPSNLHEQQESEKLLFTDRIAPWMQSIIRHSVKGIGYGVAIRIELEHFPEMTSSRRYFTIIIVHRGLSTKKIKQIESIFSKPGRISALQGFGLIVRESSNFGFRGAYQGFSNTNVWKHQSEPLVEIALPQDHSTLCGSPISVESSDDHSQPTSVSWTCGGLVVVDGTLYGLTTAHPLIVHRPDDSQGLDDDGEDDGIGPDPLLWRPWQTAGRVGHFALSHKGDVPDNCDWLLFEVGSRHQLPNKVREPDQYGAAPPWITLVEPRQQKQSSEHPVYQIYTPRGAIPATYRTESSFLIMGDSTFKTMKLHLGQRLKPGDSGAWVVRGNVLIGIVIAADGSTEDGGSAFAIGIEDVVESISKGMNDATVELPSSLDNQIMAARSHAGNGHSENVIYLCLLKALRLKGETQSFNMDTQFQVPELSAYIAVGKLFAVSTQRFQNFVHHHRHNIFFPLIGKGRTAAKLARKHYGQMFISFVSWFVETCVDSLSLVHRIEYLTLLIDEIIQRLGINPVFVPSTNEIRRLIDEIGSELFPSRPLFFRRPTAKSPLEANLKDIPLPHTGAEILLRLMTFDRTQCFYVYRGPYAEWLNHFADPQYLYWRGKGALETWAKESLKQNTKALPRAFFVLGRPDEGRHTNYGKVVRYQELHDLLLQFAHRVNK